jgi:hypothetical protein
MIYNVIVIRFIDSIYSGVHIHITIAYLYVKPICIWIQIVNNFNKFNKFSVDLLQRLEQTYIMYTILALISLAQFSMQMLRMLPVNLLGMYANINFEY